MSKLIIRKSDKFAYLYNHGYGELDKDLLSVIRFTEFEQGKKEVKFYCDDMYVGRMIADKIEITD